MTPRNRPCRASGCSAPVAGKKALCGQCWRHLPRDLRDGIITAIATRRVLRIREAEQRAIDWLRAHSPASAIARVCGGE